MSQYFYSGQIRRFLAQFIRVMSGFKVKMGRDDSGNEIFRVVPCTYGDPSRQAAQLMRANSANTTLTVPQISCYITDMKYSRERMQEPNFVKKVSVIERAIDPATGQYMNAPGNRFTVERLMPVPYDLTVKADIWTSSTDQKLQLLEQIGVLFNPSFEIQGSDTFLDWTSLSLIDLDSVQWSSRQVPVGPDDPIDIASMTFTMPIWLSTPAKVKKLGVITNIIENIYDANGDVRQDLADQGFVASDFILNINLEGSGSTMSDFATPIPIDGHQISQPNGVRTNRDLGLRVSFPYDVIVFNGSAKLIRNYQPADASDPNADIVSTNGAYVSWNELLPQLSTIFRDGVSKLFLRQSDEVEVVGTVAIDTSDPSRMLFTVDADTIPSNTQTAIDRIVNPLKSGPGSGLPAKASGQRYLLLDDIGNADDAVDALAAAWTGADGSELVARKFDIIQYNGTKWVVSYRPSNTNTLQYVTNTANGQQFKWNGREWLRSWEGLYSEGEWRLA